MIVYFGLALDDLHHPLPSSTTGGVYFKGPRGMLSLLESYLGLLGRTAEADHLRIEQYRQALLSYLEEEPDAFYAASFAADQFATASELLSRKDELRYAGWNFEAGASCPPRLRTIAGIENRILQGNQLLTPGEAERFLKVLKALEPAPVPFSKIIHIESLELLPSHWRKLLDQLHGKGISIVQAPSPEATQQSDLDHFKAHLRTKGQQGKADAANDGSILICRCQREYEAAAFTAKILKKNPQFRPLCLLEDKDRSLDQAVINEGLPAMGIQSASMSRPTLQILKLITVFLWNPLDPFKILEFVSLPVKPLDNTLANAIADLIAQTPGTHSERWYAMTNQFFTSLRHLGNGETLDAIKAEYEFWFERRRFEITEKVPTRDVIALFGRLEKWAYHTYDDEGAHNATLLTLGEQAQKIRELLEELPETELSNLELERLVRTIYEPALIQYENKELHHLPHIHQANAITGPVEDVLWWNFTDAGESHFFSRWYAEERSYLEGLGISLTTPEQENKLLIWQREQPVRYCQKRMIFVIPEMITGRSVNPHPLLSKLEAAFTSLSPLTLRIDDPSQHDLLAPQFITPEVQTVPMRKLPSPKPFIQLFEKREFDLREYETPTSLETIFYYPYQWAFRYLARLRKSAILSVVKDATLMGNLSHRVLERLFQQEDLLKWDKPAIDKWVEQECQVLFKKEGVVLLLYGMEPQRIGFIKKVKYAAWALINIIRKNDWSVTGTEMPLDGHFSATPLRGRADLVLRRGEEVAIIDLKWRGKAYREKIIRNEEDLQLVLYSRLLSGTTDWAHTAYYIMNKGVMIARNDQAFEKINTVAQNTDHRETNQRIFKDMEATYRWRLGQIKHGAIEVRCEETAADLEEEYGETLLDVLEMKTGDAPFDDYRTLIGLIE